MSRLSAEIRKRLTTLLERAESGDDIPPGQRCRLEGLLEAAVLAGEHSVDELQDLMEAVHRESSGETLEARLGADWRRRHPFPELPLFMRRAPVSPTTRD